jgi:hypothetical protein
MQHKRFMYRYPRASSSIIACLRIAGVAGLLISCLPASTDGGGGNDAGAGSNKLALGEPCLDSTACESGLCASDEVGRCVINECPVPGEPCSTPGGFCTGGSCERVCEPSRGRGAECLVFSDDGGACGFSAVCDAGLVCGVKGFLTEFGRGTCVPDLQRELSEPCGDNRLSCRDGLVCGVADLCE